MLVTDSNEDDTFPKKLRNGKIIQCVKPSICKQKKTKPPWTVNVPSTNWINYTTTTCHYHILFMFTTFMIYDNRCSNFSLDIDVYQSTVLYMYNFAWFKLSLRRTGRDRFSFFFNKLDFKIIMIIME